MAVWPSREEGETRKKACRDHVSSHSPYLKANILSSQLLDPAEISREKQTASSLILWRSCTKLELPVVPPTKAKQTTNKT